MRILALDPGERRIGIAVSDELRITARGLETFDRKSGQSFFRHLSGLIEEYGVHEIVIGFPVALSGERCSASARSEELASRIRASFAVAVTLWDERLTSKEANRVLRGSRPSKGTVDKVAAVIILQNYLDFLSGRSAPESDSSG
ncbi:MAG: Holliday junction resolvase RuvX [Chitinivibrionia bacterium]|nr:Holliday junction resolvase RuvX [Chitinivibrionia bacterium]